MTTVSSTSSSSGTSATSGASTNATSAYSNLNEADFMKLLTTQLSNQDPTAPVDNAQMLAQLAQFSTLAGVDQTNTNLGTISGQISAVTGTTGINDTSATSSTGGVSA